MPSNPNKLSQFWQELKRRRVIKVIAMYAATAFIIMEAGDIMLPRLGLPDWTVTFIIILLIIGLPLTIILAWIFDITPEGIKKTEPFLIAKKKETIPEPVKRRLKVSDGVIALLVVVVCVLIYPKIFQKDKFEGIRDPDGKISIAVMPFENLSGDTLYNVWQGGFQNLLITTLSNSEELSVRPYQAMYTILESGRNLSYASITPSIASELALKLETKTFILGTILKAGNKIRVNTQLVNAETEEIYKAYEVDLNTEDDIFTLADSLSGIIKNYLEIKKLIDQYDSPVFRGSYTTNSSEAFEYYIHGWDAFMGLDFRAAIEWLSKAIETDSGFINAYVTLSFSYSLSGNDDLSKKWCNLAYKKRDELPLKEKLMLDHLNAYYFETPNEEIKYIKQILELDELNSTYWYLLGLAYYQKIKDYREAAVYFERALEIHKKWGTNFRNPWTYRCLGDSYHQVNEHKREKEVYELGLSLFPDYTRIIQSQAVCAFSQGDPDKANEFISKYKSITKNKFLWPESRILSGVGTIYTEANLFDEAEYSYRQALELDPRNPARMNDLAWFLIDKDINANEGVDLIQKALESRPDDWNYLDTKGWGLYKQGLFEEALKTLTDAWDIRPKYHQESYEHIQEVKKALSSQNN
ncbi:MAG: tetratricopeptide repeat protein [Bacteroidia bacterium]|nr:MAG: tetratricopeptide repeat protein [Bacteroidia bacterium]